MELLAPAGGMEQLEYAVRFGADAVYLACERFGMRRRASNFKIDDLPGACSYAHERGVAVHLACNTVMHEADLEGLPDFFERAQRAGVDALIIADMGAFSLARRYAPEIDLHVSTQASVCNSAAALAWHALGAKRVVCAREMSLADIAAMHAELPDSLELEAFAHGSMCMAYSGRCIVSDHLNGRAANGGHCTQPCRWEWKLTEPSRPEEEFTVEEDGRATYLFSSRDLNMLAHLDELAAAGVDSIKLEGRGRGAFYAATVTGAYRRVLDGADPAQVAAELDTVSHHPYGTGFFFGPAHQAPYLRQSQSEWMWVAEVLACEEVDGAGEAVGEAGDGRAAPDGPKGMAGERALSSAGADGVPGGREAGRDASDVSGAQETAADGLSAPDAPGASGAEGMPAGQGDFCWRLAVRARNRFDCASELEVLSPGRPSEPVHVSCLRWVPEAPQGDAGAGERDSRRAGAPAEAAGSPQVGGVQAAEAARATADAALEPVAVEAVTRQMGRYLMLCDRPLRPHDILRARRKPSEMPPE